MTPDEKLKALAGRTPARCIWLGLPSGTAAEIAGLSGAELAVIDTEHGAIGPEAVCDMLRALAATGTRAIVRVPELSAGAVKQALDAGGGGVLFPCIETVAEAEEAVGLALYPPLGRRGQAAGVIRATRYGGDGGYVSGWNERAFVAVQIETHKGLMNAGEIAAVEGVDMLFFGPFDYAQDAELDPSHDGALLMEVFEKIVAAARAEGKIAGAFPWLTVSPLELAEAGADLIAVASDIATLAGGLRAAVQASELSISEVS